MKRGVERSGAIVNGAEKKKMVRRPGGGWSNSRGDVLAGGVGRTFKKPNPNIYR